MLLNFRHLVVVVNWFPVVLFGTNAAQYSGIKITGALGNFMEIGLNQLATKMAKNFHLNFLISTK